VTVADAEKGNSMSGNNSVTLAGNIANEPELRFTNGGTPVCNFVLAVNRRRSASGKADFIHVAVFGNDGESVANYKAKGHGIKVQGRADYQEYTAQDGSGAKRQAVKVIADKGGVTFLPQGSAISINHVELMGNLTRDPELLKVGDDIDKANFGIAVDGLPRKGEANGESDTNYFNAVAWRGLAGVVAEYKQKGDMVHILGRLTYSQWEKEGKKRSKIEVTAEDIQFLPTRRGAASANGSETNAAVPASVPAGGVPEEADDVDPEDFDSDIPF
jgi:single-strand DNA-binding protein